MKTFSINVQSDSNSDTYKIDAMTMLDAITEAINSFKRVFNEEPTVIRASQTSD